MKKIYIFDLDHTLINAKRLREDLGVILSGNKNILSEDIWNYFKLKDERVVGLLKHNMQKYIFDDVLKNLEKIKDKKILLTYGEIEYQGKKVEGLGFDKIFDKVILIDENKISFLEDFYGKNKDCKIYFINDNYNKRFSENIEVKKKIPEIEIFEVDNYNNGDKKISEIFKKICL